MSMRGIIRARGDKYFIDLHDKGKRIRIYSDDRGFTIDSYALAERILESIRYEIDCGNFDPTKYLHRKKRDYWLKTRLGVWVEKKRGEGKSKAYIQEIEGDIRRYILPHFGHTTNVRDIKTRHLWDFLRWIDGSPKTKRNILGTLSSFFTHLQMEEWIQEKPEFPAIDVPESEYRWLDRETQLKILAGVSPTIYPPLLFLICYGIRPGEVVALKWKDVDLENGVLTICRSWSRGVITHTKSKRIRHLPLHPQTEEWLLSQGKSLPESFLFGVRDPRYIRQAWNKACKELGVRCTLYHGTRHSLASQAVNAGVPLNLIGATLGHTSSKTTQRYARLDVHTLKAVIDRDNVRRIK